MIYLKTFTLNVALYCGVATSRDRADNTGMWCQNMMRMVAFLKTALDCERLVPT